MADTKTTALTELTAPVSSDIIPIVDDPGGSAVTKKITLANLFGITGRVLISEQTPTGTGTVTWSSIPATYKSLELEYVARSTENAASSIIKLWLNNDTTATNYRYTTDYGYGVDTEDAVGADSSAYGRISAATAPAGSCGSATIKIINYASTAFRKQAIVMYVLRYDDSSNFELTGNSGIEWESTAAINRVDLVLDAGNYDTGSTFRLYGVF